MKKLMFAVIGAGALMTGACSGGNDDQVNNAEMNQSAELNDIANDAAANAAEAQNLAAQQQQLEANNAEAADNTVNPEDADEQNVSGM